MQLSVFHFAAMYCTRRCVIEIAANPGQIFDGYHTGGCISREITRNKTQVGSPKWGRRQRQWDDVVLDEWLKDCSSDASLPTFSGLSRSRRCASNDNVNLNFLTRYRPREFAQCLPWNFASSPGAMRPRRSREASLGRRRTTGRGEEGATKRVTVKCCSVNLTEFTLVAAVSARLRSFGNQLHPRYSQVAAIRSVGYFHLKRARSSKFWFGSRISREKYIGSLRESSLYIE